MITKQTVIDNELEAIPLESVIDEWAESALLGDGSVGVAARSTNTDRGGRSGFCATQRQIKASVSK